MNENTRIDSRAADKFVVRLKPNMRAQVKARAKADNQTMNDCVVTAVEKHLTQGAAFDALLALVRDQAFLPSWQSSAQAHRWPW